MSDDEEPDHVYQDQDDEEEIEYDGNILAIILNRIIENGQNHGSAVQRVYQTSLPRIREKASLEKLKSNSIYRNIKEAAGYNGENTKLDEKWSVLKMLSNRERGMPDPNAQGFSSVQQCKISNNYLPNTSTSIVNLASKIYCGIFSKNGKYFITASQDNVLRLYDSTTSVYARCNRISAKHINWSILDVDFSPCNEYFVYSTWSSCLHISHVNGTYDELQCLQMDSGLQRFCMFSVKFTNCGKKLLAGGSDGCVYLYDRELNRRTKQIGVSVPRRDTRLHDNPVDVNTVAFLDETSNTIACGLDDSLIKIYDLRCVNDTDVNPEPVGVLVGHFDGVTHIDPKNDGRYFISNSKDQSIKLWDMRVFSRKGSEERALRSRLTSMNDWDYRWDEVPQEFYSGCGSMDDDVSVMTYRGHRVVQTLMRARFSPLETTGQRYIYTGCATGRLVVYDILTGNIVKTVPAHVDLVRDASWHPTRPEILTSSWDTTVGLCTYSELITKQKRSRNRLDDLFSEPQRPLRRSVRIAQRRRANQESQT